MECLGIRYRVTLQHILMKYKGRMWTGCIWLSMAAHGGLL